MRLHAIRRGSLLALLLFAGTCAAPQAAGPGPSAQALPPAPAARPASPPAGPPAAVASPGVASIDGQRVAASDLDAHQARTGLSRPEALDDLIDLTLLRAAAGANGVRLAPGDLAPAARAAAELEVARKLALDVPPGTHVLLVDHAWVKDVKSKKAQAAQRAAVDRLRGLVASGDTIPSGYEKLGISGTSWHIGAHEEYPYDVVPAEAHDLPAGSLSPVIPGNGGLHLFKIIDHKHALPDADVVRSALRPRLREGKTIETFDTGLR